MKRLSHVAVIGLLLAVGAGCDSTSTADEPSSEAESSSSVDAELSDEEQLLLDTVRDEGTVKVIVQASTDDGAAAVQLLEQLKTDLEKYEVTLGREGSNWLSATVTEDALTFLLASPDVRVYENGVKTTM